MVEKRWHMGGNFAQDLALSTIPLDQQIAMHLQGNHYPPVPLTMLQPCLYAIEACNEENYNRQIELPKGVLWRGQSTAPAHAIVEGHHLESWLLQEQEIE
jgi:hypothetical protein